MSEGTKNIIKAMKKHNIKRFVCMSAIGIGNSKEQQKGLGFLYNKILIPYLMKNMFNDKELQEQIIQESNLNWTIVRPAILTNGEKKGNYTVFSYNEKNYKPKISRADVAGFILDILNSDEYIKECVSISQ